MKANKELEAYLADFHKREDDLMGMVCELGVQLPERLREWNRLIADPDRYLCELRNFVFAERHKKKEQLKQRI